MLHSDKHGALLVGSGISIPAGYPSVQALTSIVLAGNGAYRDTDECYYINPDRRETCKYVSEATAILKRLKQTIDPSLQQYQYSGRAANYEDLVYVARQLGDFALGEIENPVVGPFLQQVFGAGGPWQATHGHDDSLGSYMRQTENYVRDIVWRCLQKEAERTEHLEVFLAALQDKSVRALAIGTLNHDTHFENYLAHAGVQVWDGFGQNENEVRYWSRTDIALDDKRVPFIKLHGSIDWFEFRPESGTAYYDDRVGVALTNDIQHTRTTDGQLQLPLPGRPLMLVGTFNKYIDYATELFSTVHARWRARLDVSDRLVICGYGFGDRGINAQIIEWVYGSRDRKLLIMNPGIEDLKNRCRGAIRNKWDGWVEDGILETIDSPVQDADSASVSRFLSS
ncbi:MAG: SIR2 family protein [Rhodospirillaceae bacterium]|nr:SIR2 family protein [Rhodospirillaceae bacterium]